MLKRQQGVVGTDFFNCKKVKFANLYIFKEEKYFFNLNSIYLVQAAIVQVTILWAIPKVITSTE